MLTFNEKLKGIKLYELIVLWVLSYIFISVLGIAEQWIYLIIIVYVTFRLKKQLFMLKDEISKTFSKITFRTWLLLTVAGYIFALGSGWFLEDLLYSSYLTVLPVNMSDLFLDFTFTVIIAPVAEEIMFRGILLNRLQEKLPLIFGCFVGLFILIYTSNSLYLLFISVLFISFLILYYFKFNAVKQILPLVLAIFVSSIAFAFLHPFVAIISSTLFGMAAAIVYLKTENIFTAVSMHMGNNLLSIVISELPFMQELFANDIFNVLLAILTLVSFVYIIQFVFRGFLELN